MAWNTRELEMQRTTRIAELSRHGVPSCGGIRLDEREGKFCAAELKNQVRNLHIAGVYWGSARTQS